MYTNLGFCLSVLSISFFSLVASIATWKSFRQQFDGPLYWIVGYVFYLASVLFVVIFFDIPNNYKHIFSNTLQMFGTYFQFLGFLSFYNKKSKKVEFIAFVMTLLLNTIGIYFQLNQKPNIYVLADFINIIINIMVFFILISKNKNIETPLKSVKLIFIFIGAISLINIINECIYIFTNGQTVISKELSMVNPVFGIIFMAILVYSQNQISNNFIRKKLEANVKTLEVIKEDLLVKNSQLLETNNNIVDIVAESLEIKLSATSNHVRRVSEFTRIILTKLNYLGDDFDTIVKAAALHDVGKIGIPDYILSSSNMFSPYEMEVMKTHAIMGYEILSKSKTDFLQLAAKIALEHHENYDGTGYPYGKKGSEISFVSRVVSIADTFDALVHKRTYKDAWTFESTVEYILQNSNIRFDPEIVKIIPECLKEFQFVLECEKPKEDESLVPEIFRQT